jgi:hypothetical protein
LDDAQLDKLTVKELQDLRANIDLAIRAVIRASRVGKTADPIVGPADPIKIDLERERDAWLSAKR